MRRDSKKDDSKRQPGGLLAFCDARAAFWSLVIPLSVILVLLVRSRTSRWGLGTSSARALRFDRVDKIFNPNKTADPPDMDPAFDPEADAARVKADTAATAQARLAEAAAKVERTEGSRKRKTAIAAGEDTDAKPRTSGAGRLDGDAAVVRKLGKNPAGQRVGGSGSGSGSGSGRTASAAAEPEGSRASRLQHQRRGHSGSAAGAVGGKLQKAQPAASAQSKAAAEPSTKQRNQQLDQQPAASEADSQQDTDLFELLASHNGGSQADDDSKGNAAAESSHTDSTSEREGGNGSGSSRVADGSSGSGGSYGSSSDTADVGDSNGRSSGNADTTGGGSSQPAEAADQETRTSAAMMSVKPEKKERPRRRRKTDTRFLVLPAHACQLLDDPLANACMYGGLDAARRPECTEATKGKTSNSYMPAFTRIAPYISQFGPRKFSVGPVWDAGSEAAKEEWQSRVDAADVLIMDELALLYLGSKVEGKKVVVLQHDAAASMRTCDTGVCASSILKQDRLLGYLQHTSLVPLSRNNAPRVHDTVHFDLLDHLQRGGAADAHRMEPQPQQEQPFSEAMLAKVHTIIPLLWRWRFPITCRGRPEFTEYMMKALQGGVGDYPPMLRPLHERSVDLSFIGRLQPGRSWRQGQEVPDELFRVHRQQLFDSVRKLEHDAPEIRVMLSEPVAYEAFAQGLRDTKMFISPLGKAESSGKDYEAIISRALLIKPMASMLRSYPNIYEVNVTCVEVKPDYSDLEAVVKSLLGNPERMQRIADAAFQRLLAHASERPVAQDIAETLMDIVERNNPSAIVYLD